MNVKFVMVFAVVVVVILAAVIFIRNGFWGGSVVSNNTVSGSGASSVPDTRQDLGSGNVNVPGTNATSVPDGVAVPQSVAPASPTGSAKLRIFSLSIDSNKFSQNIIAVNLGDTVHINITAVDGSYDFYQPDYGLKAILVRGQTKPAEFQATAAGRFTFYCQSCGGPDKGPVGYLEVAAQ